MPSKEVDYQSIINQYYAEDDQLRRLLLFHSRQVADRSLAICRQHPELKLDVQFVEEAAMLHDIGIFRTNAPSIQCFGTEPYICHGTIGAQLMREEGFPQHALVCERHTGSGLSLLEIERQNLPVPHRDMLPLSLEEKLICYADKFFSKTHLERERTVEQARNSLLKFGEEGIARFDTWIQLFS
ncbi:MAG: HDIG domain-containing protein [Bacteroidaceae bacterium]|nr:HDIG domain-containing protein [Bacteroidaceae bacterium]